jgi:interferon gamma-inducible protein 30
MKRFSLILALLTYYTAICKAIPNVDVYFESLCPGCRFFITNTFSTFHQNPGRHMLANVTFYPYGNANETWDGSKWVFTCQHGNNECFGNIVDTCARSKMDKETFHTFLICLEGYLDTVGYDFNKATFHCISDHATANTILNCAAGDEGNRLEHEVAVSTPVHTHVPWIVFNGVHDPQTENSILQDMVSFLCNYMADPTIPGCPTTEGKSVNLGGVLQFLQ